MSKRRILLNPGPVTLTDRVKRALVSTDLCHREPAFAEVLMDIRHRLVEVYPESRSGYEAVVLTGSGTAAVEAMLISLVPPDARVLVLSNGAYGERMHRILENHGRRPVLQLQHGWLDSLDLPAVTQNLKENPDTRFVAVVHNETTTGRLNDIGALGRLCREYECQLLVDAVSSFGAEEIRFDAWNLAALAGCANKCLHGAPGIAFVIAEHSLLEPADPSTGNFYLNLPAHIQAQRSGQTLFTQAVPTCLALQEALKELEETGGRSARCERYRAHSETIRQRLKSLGIETLVEPEATSSMVTAFRLPEGMAYSELERAFLAKNFVPYPGQGPMTDRVFRIATMGDIQDDDIDRLLPLLDQLFGSHP